MEAIAAGSRSHGNFMYQANISPRADEHLTEAQWKEAVDTLEKNLGLEGHQRVVVEHEKEGRTHRHVMWNRVDVENLHVADMGGNWRIHTTTARQLEIRFDHTPTPSPTSSLDHKPALELWEVRAAERSGIDPAALKEELTELWRRTDSGKAFAAAIEERGYVLAKGDRRDFCVVDQAGDAHSLARRLNGVKAKDVREHMSDVDRDSLPTVAEARAQQHKAAKERPEAAPTLEQPKDIMEAWRNKEAGRQAEVAEPTTEQPKDIFEAWRNKEASRQAEAVAPIAPEITPIELIHAKHAQAEAEKASFEAFKARAEAEGLTPKELGQKIRQEKWREDTKAKVSHRIEGRTPTPEKAALSVANAVTGAAEKLTDFALSFLGGGGASQPPQDPATVDAWAEIKAERKAAAALGKIRESMERGESLSASDIQNLTPTHLQNIARHGDDYLRQLIERMERDRHRDNDWGRERER
jgi:hypothetical protein